jgi:hypothetical protein
MIDVLLSGRLHGKATARTDKHGHPYATCKVRVPTRDAAVQFVNVICFARPEVTVLLTLEEGDGVAIAGELTPSAWIAEDGTARPVLDVLAHRVLTEYHVARKRKAVREAPERREESPARLPFDDDLPGAA